MIECKPSNFWRTAVIAAIAQRTRLAAGLALGGLLLVNHPRLPQGSYFARAMKPAEYRGVLTDQVSPGELLVTLLFDHPDVLALQPGEALDSEAAGLLFEGTIRLAIVAAPGNGPLMGGTLEEYRV